MLKVFDLSFAQMRELFDLTPYASDVNKFDKFLYTTERAGERTSHAFPIFHLFMILHRSIAYLSVTKMSQVQLFN